MNQQSVLTPRNRHAGNFTLNELFKGSKIRTVDVSEVGKN